MNSGDLAGPNALSIIVLGASESRRKHIADTLGGTHARIIKDCALPSIDEMQLLLHGECDVFVIDLGDDPERPLAIVEAACDSQPQLTVMVCARDSDPALLMRAMRAGAREFLSDPLSSHTFFEAMERARARRDEIKRKKKVSGKCIVFVGAKGGSGVTTVAINFAVALARESTQSVALLDLDLGLGDAALDLGISGEFSTLDALKNEARLDSEFVSKLLVRHSSGLQVLAGPDEFTNFRASAPAVLKLVNILRSEFAWLVVDAGANLDSYSESLFELAEKTYLVTQVTVAELRNSHRFINAFFSGDNASRLEVVLNRYATRAGDIDDQSIAKALTVAPSWRLPNDDETVHAAQNTASPFALKDSAISRMVAQMARAACGKTTEDTRKRRFSLFG